MRSIGPYQQIKVSLEPKLFDRLLFLARLSISDVERKVLMHDLTNTLAMIDSIHDAPTNQVPPLQSPSLTTLRLRADAVTEQVDRNALQQPASVLFEGLYAVPKVIE